MPVSHEFPYPSGPEREPQPTINEKIRQFAEHMRAFDEVTLEVAQKVLASTWGNPDSDYRRLADRIENPIFRLDVFAAYDVNDPELQTRIEQINNELTLLNPSFHTGQQVVLRTLDRRRYPILNFGEYSRGSYTFNGNSRKSAVKSPIREIYFDLKEGGSIRLQKPGSISAYSVYPLVDRKNDYATPFEVSELYAKTGR